MFLRFIIFSLLGLISGLFTTLSLSFLNFLVLPQNAGYIPICGFLLGGFFLGIALVLGDYVTSHPKRNYIVINLINVPLTGVFSALCVGFLFAMFFLMSFDGLRVTDKQYYLTQLLYYVSSLTGYFVTMFTYRLLVVKKNFNYIIAAIVILLCFLCTYYPIAHMYREEIFPDFSYIYPFVHMILAGGLSQVKSKS
jgi:hypothetical protein